MTLPDEPSRSPTTPEEWWTLCDFHKDNLRRMVQDFHPSVGRQHSMPITAPGAEAACEVVRREIQKLAFYDPVEHFDLFLEKRDAEMASLLNQTWFGIPESLDCWALPGFDVLCDLCSESWALQPADDGEWEE